MSKITKIFTFVRYCTNCLQPSTKPNDVFHASGICSACLNFENNKDINYERRFKQLKAIISEQKRKKRQYYDCIIGVSGGKDSTRQALWVRDKLKLNPLLISLSYTPEQVSNIGVNNLSNLIELGFDIRISSLSPQTWRILVREAFLRFANWCRATEIALYSSVPQMAIREDINLIFIGENQSLRDQKTMGEHGWQYDKVIEQNTLNGGDIDWMRRVVSNEKLIPYKYPSPDEIAKSKIQIIDLGWFIGDWENVKNGMIGACNGLKLRNDSIENTGDLEGISALDEDWVTLNQMIRYYKFGYAKVTDYLNEDIRAGRITRDDAIKVAEKYDGSCSYKYIDTFCKYIGISTDKFWDIVHKNVNKKLFSIDNNGKICPKFKVGYGLLEP